MKTKKKKNPTDTTLRNNRALHKLIAKLERRIARLERVLVAYLAD